jgi:hypothetical protein
MWPQKTEVAGKRKGETITNPKEWLERPRGGSQPGDGEREEGFDSIKRLEPLDLGKLKDFLFV